MRVHEIEVKGVNVDGQTHCAHYHGAIDIIAVKFKCCGEWFPCYECHAELTAHPPRVWSADEFHAEAVLCGNCGYRMAIEEYLNSGFACPQCAALFNPGCADHYHLYFERRF